MYVEMAPRCTGVDRNLDLFVIRDLVLPVFVHERVFLGHGNQVINQVWTGQGANDELVE